MLAERARGLAAPSDYSDLLNNCARLPDTSLDGFHNFIDRFVESAAVSEATLIPDVHLAGRRGCARSGSGSAGG